MNGCHPTMCSELILGNVSTTKGWWLFIQVQIEFLEEISKAFEVLVCNISFSYRVMSNISGVTQENMKRLWFVGFTSAVIIIVTVNSSNNNSNITTNS